MVFYIFVCFFFLFLLFYSSSSSFSFPSQTITCYTRSSFPTSCNLLSKSLAFPIFFFCRESHGLSSHRWVCRLCLLHAMYIVYKESPRKAGCFDGTSSRFSRDACDIRNSPVWFQTIFGCGISFFFPSLNLFSRYICTVAKLTQACQSLLDFLLSSRRS